MARYQRGSLRQELRVAGATWVLRYKTTRREDGKRVERTVAVGLVRDYPSESAALQRVDVLHLRESINTNEDFKVRPVRFADIAAHYIAHELDNDQADAIMPKSHTTISNYRRNLKKRIIPQWGGRVATTIQPPEIEEWLRSLRRDEKLANGTCDRHRRIMALVYTSAQRYGLLPRGDEHNPFTGVRCRIVSDYEAMIITPAQAFAIWSRLREPENVLLLLAASTGLRISECLGLQWADVNFAAQLIRIRRSWTGGKIGRPKTASSRAAVPCGPVLSRYLQGWCETSPYSQDGDWIFPSFRNKGKTPRVANMLCSDHLRPAAIAAGVLKEDQDVRFGFHTMRHSLASFLVGRGENPTVVQSCCDIAT